MAIIDRQVKDRIVTRGLGLGSEDKISGSISISGNIINFVYEEKLYYPTTGIYSDIEGWHWDRTEAQTIAIDDDSKLITSSLGGIPYNLKDGIPEDMYSGNVISGCELLNVEEKDNKWIPEISTGKYSVAGVDKKLFSNNSICKVASGGEVNLSNYNYNRDDLLVAIYKRDENYRKLIFREFKDTNSIYSYKNTNDVIVINNYKLFVGADTDDTNQIKSSWEEIGVYSGIEFSRVFYLKYFGVDSASIKVAIYDGFSTNVLNNDDFILDAELGIITIKDTVDILGTVYCKYIAIPRVDIELETGTFKSNLDLKPHHYKQCNGIIEVSTEDRHLARLILSTDKDSFNYGSDSCLLTVKARNRLDKAVDEIPITLYWENDAEGEGKFEGNLDKIKIETNSSGEAFARASFPLTNFSSSKFFDTYNQAGFPTEDTQLTMADIENVYLFEYLKVDPFYGSSGLTIDVTIENDSDNKVLIINEDLASEDYKIFRNLLALDEVVKLVDTETDCFKKIYNSGFALYENNSASYKISIKEIGLNKIYLNTPVNDGITSVVLFKKNENHSGKGVPLILYDSSGKILRPDRIADGKIIYYFLSNRQDSLVKGYRIFYPKTFIVRAKAKDPATGIDIHSDEVELNISLASSYIQKIELEGVGVGSNIGVASFLGFGASTRSIYLEGN